MANYIQGLFHGIRTLLTGLKVTGKEFVTPKITEQYPENRATLKMRVFPTRWSMVSLFTQT